MFKGKNQRDSKWTLSLFALLSAYERGKDQLDYVNLRCERQNRGRLRR